MVTEKYIDFLFDMYSNGATLPQAQLNLLMKHGRLKSDLPDAPAAPKEQENEVEFPIGVARTEIEALIDSEISVSFENAPKEEISIFDPKNHVHAKFLSVNCVTEKMWRPESIVYHKDEFVKWIDSFIFYGFQNMIAYEKFELYKKQAYDWLLENDTLSNYDYPEDIAEFKQRELDRCAENSLYCLNKYGKVKDATIPGGWRIYIATKAHEVICYLDDCNYSFLILKPRQMAATSTIGLLAAKHIIFRKNYFIKYITEDEEKGLEIYNDKIKASFTAFPAWMVPTVANWNNSHLRLADKGKEKGREEGVGSSILVDAPTVTAVAGGSPNKSLVDEAGNIKIFRAMMQNANPTMFSQDPNTGLITMTRQFIGWGTAGDMEGGGKSFEFEYMNCVESWKKRKFGSGIIPIFFDWTCRPGITQEFYDQKKEEAFSKTGPEAAAARIDFYQAYPSNMEECFMSKAKTLVDADFIKANEDKINNLKEGSKEQYGYFEPVYNFDKPMPEGSDTPYEIKDVEFIKCDEADPRVTTIIFQHPKPGWEDRYYQGTDPIASDSGLSNMASAIWDAEYNTISAVVDYREQNYKAVFLQCLLLGMYYDIQYKKGTKDLLESNIGAAYRDYKEFKGKFDTMVFTSELPDSFRTKSGTQLIGIDNKMVRNKLIIDKLFELLQAYGDRIYIRRVWTQLKTFVCKVTDQGNETWGPFNRKIHKDDVLWAVVYSYLCRITYANKIPKKIDAESKRQTVHYPLYRDENGKLRRKAVKINA